jgi:hypothetical protein
MNTFELKIIESDKVPYAPSNMPPGMIIQQIWVDGVHLNESPAVDVEELVRSLSRAGEFYFFTCSCGQPGCARIWDGIDVRHDLEKILWKFRRPMRHLESDLSDEKELELWISTTSVIEYEFDRDQFISAMDRGQCELKSKPIHSVYSPYGFTRTQLDYLDAREQPMNSPSRTGNEVARQEITNKGAPDHATPHQS